MERRRENQARRHHYVPRFLLQRFAQNPGDRRSRVYQLDVTTGRCRLVNPNNAAVTRDFYAFVDDAGNRNGEAERAFAELEAIAAPLIGRLAEPGSRLEDDDRCDLAVFLTMLWLRTPLWRERFRRTGEETLKFVARHASPGYYQSQAHAAGETITLQEAAARREAIVASIDRGDVQVKTSPARRHIGVLFDNAATNAWIAFRHDWSVVRAPEGAAYVLADEPVTVCEVVDGRARGIGKQLASARSEMVVPLDPRFALLLTPGEELLADAARGSAALEVTTEQIEAQIDRPVVWRERVATADEIDDINLRSYAQAQSWIYGQTQARLTDLRRAARGARRHRVADLRPRALGFTVRPIPGQPEHVLRMPERSLSRARPRRG